MSDPILIPTGGPRLAVSALAAASSSSAALPSVDLPLPDFGDHMNGRLVDESRFSRRISGSQRLVEARSRLRFTFGYRDLDLDVAESLIAILTARLVTFTPRTARASDPSGAAAEELQYECRVLGRIPMTRHLVEGYRITVDLEELTPGAALPHDDLSPPDLGSPGGAASGGGSPLDEEPPAVGDESASGAPCANFRAGIATMPLGDTGPVEIAPDPPLALALDDTDAAQTGFSLVELSGTDELRLYISEIGTYHFSVNARSAPSVDTDFRWFAGQRSKGVDCLACWRRNTWHTSDSPCAPFPDIPATAALSNWTNSPSALLDRVIGTAPGNIFAGGDMDPLYGRLWLYDLDSPGWSYSPPFPASFDFVTEAPSADPDDRVIPYYLLAVDGRFWGLRQFIYDAELVGMSWVNDDRDVFSWAPGETQWTVHTLTTPDLGPYSFGTQGAVVHFEGDAYLIGRGQTPAGSGYDVWKFDGSSFTVPHTFADLYTEGAACVADSKIYFMGGKKNGGNTTEIWTSAGGAFALASETLPASQFLAGIGASGDGAAIYCNPVMAGGIQRFDLTDFFVYPADVTTVFSGAQNSVISVDGLVYVMGGSGAGRYTMYVYVPFEGNPLNPFTGEAAQ